LEAIAGDKVNVKKVITHWPDVLRVAGSWVANQVSAYDLLRMFGREGHPAPLGQAFAEYGRIAKTLHLLAAVVVIDPMDDTYRRPMHRQLTVQESPAQAGLQDLPQQEGHHPPGIPGRDGRSVGLAGSRPECRGALNDEVHRRRHQARLRAEGHEIRDEDVALLSPFKYKNLNVLGRYTFTAPQPVGGLRPMRDPEAVDLDDDDDGQVK
jgi:hypothetical protein